jgi:glycopeptide antibiotics resistance protein
MWCHNIKQRFIRFTCMSMIKLWLWVIFIAVLLLLTKNILFKKSPGYYKRYFRNEYRHYNVENAWKHSNTKPFSTIQLFYNSRRLKTEYKQDNLLGNLLGFAPIGFLLPLLIPLFRKGIYVLLAGFFLSLGFEMTQLILGLGIFDVDDLILNTAGCFMGYGLFRLASSVLSVKGEKALVKRNVQNKVS